MFNRMSFGCKQNNNLVINPSKVILCNLKSFLDCKLLLEKKTEFAFGRKRNSICN